MAVVQRATLIFALLLLSGCCAQASSHSMRSLRNASLADERRADDSRVTATRNEDRAPTRIAVGRGFLPNGRAIAGLSTRECRRLLRESSVRFDPLPPREAPAIKDPLALRSSILGVQFGPANGMAKNGVVDCRLAVALLAWAPILRDAGVVKVEHYSTFRPGARVRGTGKASGHSHALAIDAARFYMRDGRELVILDDWDEREKGGAPCPVRRSEDDDGRVLRQVVCRAVERDLFQVVITPHHDRDHQNHVHLELVPGSNWSFIH